MTDLGIMKRGRELLDAADRCSWEQEVRNRRATRASNAKRTTRTKQALHPMVHLAFSPRWDSLARIDMQSV
jgi:hypothetical protein